MKKLLCVLLLFLLLCGCSNTPAETSAELTESDITAARITQPIMQTQPIAETKPEESLPESEKPKILTSFFIYDDEIAVGGTVQSGAVVTAHGDGYVQSQSAQAETFFISLPCPGEYRITAILPGCAESEAVEFSAKKDKNAELSNCYAGSGSQLFLKAHIDDYQGKNLFNTNQIGFLKAKTKENIEKLRKTTGKDTRLIYLIVPDPQTLYPELAPDALGEMNNTSRISQFMQAAGETDGVTVIDLTPVLTAHKSEGMLIKQTDSHWTELAGFYAYEALHKEILKDYPDIKTVSATDFTLVTKKSVVGNYITDKSLLYEEETYLHPKFEYKNPLYKHMSEDTIQNLHIRGEYEVSTGDSSLPSCLFVRDSFSTCIMKYMAEDFSYMFMQEMWVHKIDFDKAGQIKPDYVIHLLLQNNLGELLLQ